MFHVSAVQYQLYLPNSQEARSVFLTQLQATRTTATDGDPFLLIYCRLCSEPRRSKTGVDTRMITFSRPGNVFHKVQTYVNR
jgi:hypothetical protein